MRLLIAEKPDMARKIAEAIGVKGRGNGCIQGKDLEGRDVTITWCIGHLCELLTPEELSPDWKSWSWGVLPMLPGEWKTKVSTQKRDQFNVIKDLAAKATEVVVATDAGREGELIASLVLNQARVKKPTLRLWTSSLTDGAVREAYRTMKPWSQWKGLQDAAHGRSRADWLVGMNATRGLTLLAQANGRTEKGAWSVGRVQTPTLSLLVERELEIRAFKPRDFWVLEGTFRHPAGVYKGRWFSEGKAQFSSEKEAQDILGRLHGRPAKVHSFETKPEHKRAEQLYDLTTLQREANRRFRFSSEKTLEVAQSLYEAQVLSYPRTGSRHLTQADAAKIPSWLTALKGLSQYAGFVAEIPAGASLGKRFVDDSEVEDHTALVPTEKTPHWEGLSEDQRKIYDLVARRFLAAFFPDRVEARTTLITHVLTELGPESFKTTGLAVLELGWSRVDTPAQAKAKKKGKGAEDDEVEEKPLQLSGAPVAGGDAVDLLGIDSEARKTTPPKRYTEADLLLAMQTAGKDLEEDELRAAMKECSGIGTPATRASIIEKLLDRGSQKYPKTPMAERQANHIVPTDKGIQLIQMVPFPDLRSAEMTARWETALDQMARGKGSLEAFMKGIEEYTRQMVTTFRGGSPAQSGAQMAEAPEAPAGPRERFEPTKTGESCPKCGSDLLRKAFDGRHYVKCASTKAQKCYFGYDTDAQGNPSIECKACGGRVKTAANGGHVCGDCGQWQDKLQGGSSKPSGATAQDLGACPKCKKGQLRARSGQYGPFVACSDREGCGLLYNTNQAGKPKAGHCKACQGPMQALRGGGTRCTVCSASGDAGGGSGDARPPKPPDATCPYCQERTKTVFTKRNTWSYRCDPCDRWLAVPGQPKTTGRGRKTA